MKHKLFTKPSNKIAFFILILILFNFILFIYLMCLDLYPVGLLNFFSIILLIVCNKMFLKNFWNDLKDFVKNIRLKLR